VRVNSPKTEIVVHALASCDAASCIASEAPPSFDPQFGGAAEVLITNNTGAPKKFPVAVVGKTASKGVFTISASAP
jgi:hypothetical protein